MKCVLGFAVRTVLIINTCVSKGHSLHWLAQSKLDSVAVSYWEGWEVSRWVYQHLSLVLRASRISGEQGSSAQVEGPRSFHLVSVNGTCCNSSSRTDEFTRESKGNHKTKLLSFFASIFAGLPLEGTAHRVGLLISNNLTEKILHRST